MPMQSLADVPESAEGSKVSDAFLCSQEDGLRINVAPGYHSRATVSIEGGTVLRRLHAPLAYYSAKHSVSITKAKKQRRQSCKLGL